MTNSTKPEDILDASLDDANAGFSWTGMLEHTITGSFTADTVILDPVTTQDLARTVHGSAPRDFIANGGGLGFDGF